MHIYIYIDCRLIIDIHCLAVNLEKIIASILFSTFLIRMMIWIIRVVVSLIIITFYHLSVKDISFCVEIYQIVQDLGFLLEVLFM